MIDIDLPLAIIPGMGLLILSTSNLMINLSNEIDSLIKEQKNGKIITAKLSQLKILNSAMVLFYVAVAMLVSTGVISGFCHFIDSKLNLSAYLSIAGITSALLGVLGLIIYSYRAVNIRQTQFISSTKGKDDYTSKSH